MKKIILLFLFLVSAIGEAQETQQVLNGGLETAFLSKKHLTTTERDAIVIEAGKTYEIYNVTTGQYEGYNGSTWEAIGFGGGGSNAVDISSDDVTFDVITGTNVQANLVSIDNEIFDLQKPKQYIHLSYQLQFSSTTAWLTFNSNSGFTTTNTGLTIGSVATNVLYQLGTWQETVFYNTDKTSSLIGINTNVNDYYTIY